MADTVYQLDFAQQWRAEISEAIDQTNRVLAAAGCAERVSLQLDGCAGQRSASFRFGSHDAHLIAFDSAAFLSAALNYLRAVRHTAAAFAK